MTAVSVCITWSRPDDEHARGLCTNTLQLETQPPEIDKPLPCYVCVNPVSPGRVEGCRQCADWDTNDKLVRYIGQATDPDEVLPNAIEFALDGSIGGTVANQLITQVLARTNDLSPGGTRYLYTPVLNPAEIMTSGILKQLSASSSLASAAWSNGAEIAKSAESSAAATAMIENDNSCVWGTGEYWTHFRAYVGPRGYSVGSVSMLTDNVHFECVGGRLSSSSRPLVNRYLPISCSTGTELLDRVVTSATFQQITGFSGVTRTEPSEWKWPDEIADIYSLVGSTSTANLMFPQWLGSGNADVFGRSGMNYGNVFQVDSANLYTGGNFYDYVSEISGDTIPDHIGAGDAESGSSMYWTSGDPFDPSYYNENCRSEFRHRRYISTGKAVVGYRWNLYNYYPSSPTDLAGPGGGGYGTLLKLSYTLPVKNNTPTKVPLWTWCDVTRPGYRTAGNLPPALAVESCRWCGGIVGECAPGRSGGSGNVACCKGCIERTAVNDPRASACWKVTYTSHGGDITLGSTGCCERWSGTNTGNTTENFDAFFMQQLVGSCGWRTMNPTDWTAIAAQTTYWWGMMFWGVDQLNPSVTFQSGWLNWLATTNAEDIAVKDQLCTAGKLPSGVRPAYVDDNTLAVYKVTKSLAHCDKKRFDLKLIWARTEAYGVTFDGPKSVPSTYPSTGSISWD